MTAVVEDKGNLFTTATGRIVYPLAPTVDMIDIEDIAQSLSNQCRFSGHVKEFYSVAEHSVRVAQCVQEMGGDDETVFWALMHDASEAYLVDLARPIKYAPSFAQGYLDAEAMLMSVIAERYGLQGEMPPIVKRADNILLSTEQRDLMPPGDIWYPDVPRLDDRIRPVTPKRARAAFLKSFENLYKEV